MGQVTHAGQELSYWQEIDPPNSFLRSESILLGGRDETLWHHLAGDPERILELAVEYMAMGFYDDALQLLNRNYPSSPVYSEPGTALPEDYPLISYYRGYCREQLGLPGGPDFEIASRQSTLYVFPNRPETLQVLQSALKHAPDDATAHLLLGSLHLSGGKSQKAVQEWQAARRLNPHLPTLHRNLGFTQLIAFSDPKAALSTFSEGLKMDPENIDNYLGSDQCMSLLDGTPQERIRIFKSYPDFNSMPSALLLSLALALTEAGRFEEAEALFPDREFIREEFGTSVHEVYMEVQLQKALALVRTGTPDQAQPIIRNLGVSVPGLSFTAEGRERFLNNKRVQYYLGEILEQCGDTEAAQKHWQEAAAAEGYGDLYFGYLAAGRLDRDVTGSEWKARLETGLEAAKSYSGFNQGRATYAQGALLLALDRREEAFKILRNVFLLPDKGRSHYLTRELLRREEGEKEL
jgi:tetratricopeptide (TPR) repeat protein